MIRIRFVNPDAKPVQSRAENEPQLTTASPDTKQHAAHGIEAVAPESSHSSPPADAPVAAGPWLRSLGWSQSPFTSLPLEPVRHLFVGHTEARDACQVLIEGRGSFAVFRGEAGLGKSALLSWLAAELEAQPDVFRVVRLQGGVSLDEATRILVAPYTGFLRSYRGETPEELAQFLAERERRRIAVLVDDADRLGGLEPILRSMLAAKRALIVLAAIDPPLLSEAHVTVALGRLRPIDAVELVKRRIAAVGGSGLAPFTNDQLLDWWDEVGMNVGSFLRRCESRAEQLAREPARSTTEDSIRQANTETHAPDVGRSPRKRESFDALIETLAEPDTKKKK